MCTSLLRAFQRYQKQTEKGGKGGGEEVVMARFSRVKACSHTNKTNDTSKQAILVLILLMNHAKVEASQNGFRV